MPQGRAQSIVKLIVKTIHTWSAETEEIIKRCKGFTEQKVCDLSLEGREWSTSWVRKDENKVLVSPVQGTMTDQTTSPEDKKQAFVE